MLFHPYESVKVFGITVWPQGMIPRHREKLAQSIGNAVGNELVSQQTVFDALFETSFFQRKVEDFVGAYQTICFRACTRRLSMPCRRRPRADSRHDLRASVPARRVHRRDDVKSEETAEAIERFVDKQVDELLERRVGDMVSDKSFGRAFDFVEQNLRRLIAAEGFESKVTRVCLRTAGRPRTQRRDASRTFTPETIAFIKDRIDQQVPPIVHHLAEIATSQPTRKQIGGLIKREVDEYYEQLSLFKKIFISRERIHREVDELVNKTLPKRVEEYLRGPAFEQEAETFLNATIDKVMARPLDELVGQFDSFRFGDLKTQISNRLIEILRSEALSTSLSIQVSEAMDRLRPQTLGEVMQAD